MNGLSGKKAALRSVPNANSKGARVLHKRKVKVQPSKTLDRSKNTLIELTNDPFMKSIIQLQIVTEEEINMNKKGEITDNQLRNFTAARRNQYRGIEALLKNKHLDILAGKLTRSMTRVLPLPVAAGQQR